MTEIVVYTVLATGALAGVAFWLAGAVSRRLVRPMRALQEGVRRIGEGDLDHRIDIPENRELAQLARAFNTMAERLAESYRTLEQTVADRTMALSTLHTLAVTANRSLNPDEIVTSVLDRVPVVLNLEGGFIRIRDDDGLTLRAHRGMPAAFVDASSVCAIGEGCSGRVAESGTPQIWTQPPDGAEALLFREGFRVVACVPITAKEHVVGTLAVASRYPRTFTPQDLQLLGSIGNQLGTTLENAGLYERACAMVDEFQQLDRLKTEFLSNVSHELRVPLTSVLGFAELLLERIPGELNEDQDKYVRTMIESGRDLLQMINNLLDLSKINAGKIEWRPAAFDLHPLIDAVERTIRPLVVKQRLQWMVDTDPRPLLVFADEARVKQVLLNLLSNAVKFTPPGGAVTLRVHPTEGLGGSAIGVCVEDSGVGISAREVERIFDEFHQIDGSPTRNYPGTGLGLSITKRLVELQGGAISVESRLGEGSRFTVLLPCGTASEPVGAPTRPASIMQSVMESLVANAAARVQEDRGSPATRILIVEPQPELRHGLRTALESEGYEASILGPNESVFARVREIRPFIVIVNVIASDAQAWVLLRDLRSLPDVQTVLFAPSDDGIHACSLGPMAYLATPFVPDALRGALRRHGVLRHVRRKPATLLVVAEPGMVAAVRSAVSPDGVGVVGADSATAVASVGELRPDLILVDLAHPSLNPFELVQRFEQHSLARTIPIMGLLPDAVDEAVAGRLTACARAAANAGELLRDDIVAECRKLERWLPERAGLVDPATRLYAERYFRHCLAEEVDRAWKLHRSFAVLLLEADGVMRSPDLHNRPRVERLLREVADMLRRHTRSTNPICRYGPYAFAMIVSDISKDGAWFIAEKLRVLVADSAFPGRGYQGRMTLSGGVAAFFDDADTADRLVEASLRALRRAQQAGGNRVEGADREEQKIKDAGALIID